MEQDVYTQHWKTARHTAESHGLQIIEHGWEQHVIIDETNDIVYRYPRHAAAAAKLEDEVSVLRELHKRSWPIKLPVMREHNTIFTSYNLIVGQVLSSGVLATLTDSQITYIGEGLGEFLVYLHHFDKAPIEQKKTKQTTTLLAYYAARIGDTPGTPLQELLKSPSSPQVVVHGDLHGLNIVVDKDTKVLRGVIDLSEMEIGDPHQDFRKLFMTDPRLLEPAVNSYHQNGGSRLNIETIKTWAYVNEWANLCHFAETPSNPTYQRALRHLRLWEQI